MKRNKLGNLPMKPAEYPHSPFRNVIIVTKTKDMQDNYSSYFNEKYGVSPFLFSTAKEAYTYFINEKQKLTGKNSLLIVDNDLHSDYKGIDLVNALHNSNNSLLEGMIDNEAAEKIKNFPVIFTVCKGELPSQNELAKKFPNFKVEYIEIPFALRDMEQVVKKYLKSHKYNKQNYSNKNLPIFS